MTFSRQSPPKKCFSAQKIFLWPFFSHLPQKITLHPSHFKENFPWPRNFPMTLLVIIYQTKISLHPIFCKCSDLRDFYTFLLFLSKTSWKGPGMPWFIIWYCNTNIQNIHSSFSFPGRLTPFRRVPSQKNPEYSDSASYYCKIKQIWCWNYSVALSLEDLIIYN